MSLKAKRSKAREEAQRSSFEFLLDFLSLRDSSHPTKGPELKSMFDHNFSFLQTMLLIMVFMIVMLGIGLGGLLFGLSILGV